MAEAERWIWLGGSLLLAVASTQAAWWLWRWEKTRARLDRFVHSPFFSPLLQIIRLFYYLGFPFAALQWGRDAIVEGRVGLRPIPTNDAAANWADWAGDAGWGAGLGIAAGLLLAAGWWAVRRVNGPSHPSGARVPPWILLREAAFHEVHWSFYRNAPVVALGHVLGTTAGTYWGIWAGLGVVTVEAALNPWWWADLRDKERAPARLLRIGLAVLSSVLYLKTENLWLGILVHWGLTWGLVSWVRALAASIPPGQYDTLPNQPNRL